MVFFCAESFEQDGTTGVGTMGAVHLGSNVIFWARMVQSYRTALGVANACEDPP